MKEPEIRGVGEVADVESLDGVRVKLDEDTNRPFVEYLVKWKVTALTSLLLESVPTTVHILWLDTWPVSRTSMRASFGKFRTPVL